MIFLRVLPKIFLCPHYSGGPAARGPRFIESPKPPVPTPLLAENKNVPSSNILECAMIGTSQVLLRETFGVIAFSLHKSK